ncbi:hypothetical protein O181_111723 [Austropuccinia psidii MF-1]|uniref:Uncharacterized protein n=1 Tax=Austropuccinia psidii MF-1 TaxID=1389203 RepID=A0A9Q3K022_9BASI|nr:hypothetical protein [Austropuccinia psidii MF-1]
MCGENGGKWKKYLPWATLADIISTKRTTGFSPYELQFGQLPVLPIEIETKTFLAVEWHKISTTEELREARAKQLEGKEEMRRKAAEKLKKSRENSMKYGYRRMAHQLRSPLKPGDFVLVYNKAIQANGGLLFKNKWNGPYRVNRQINNEPYELEELDGTELARRSSASQVKTFYQRGKLIDTKEDTEEEQSGEDELINEEEVFEETTESVKNRELSPGMLGTALNGEGDVVFHTIFFTRLKLIVPHNSSKSSLEADLHSNFTPKGQFYRKKLDLTHKNMAQAPKGSVRV